MRISDKFWDVLDARVKKSALSWMNPMFWTQVSWKEWILFWPMEKFLDSLKVNITYLCMYVFDKSETFILKAWLPNKILNHRPKGIKNYFRVWCNYCKLSSLMIYIIKMLSMKNVGWMMHLFLFFCIRCFFSSFENVI